MKKILMVLFSVTGFISCSKPVVEKPVPDSHSEMSRSLVFPNRNGEIKSASYIGKGNVEAKAQLLDGFVYITIDASPKTNNTAGEFIQFKIDQSHLQTGLVKTYNFIDPTSKIVSSYYSYIKKDSNGGIGANIVNSQTGIAFEGLLKINSYDSALKLIEGEFMISVKQLLQDPTRGSALEPIDPLNKCDLTVTGGFQNVILK